MAVKQSRRRKAKRTLRRRRTAEEARREVLDAAERCLREDGPEGIRLQQIAADAGLTHSTLLHHFGSRECLIEALVERAMRGLASELTEAIQARDPAASAPATLERVFRTLGDGGHAQLLIWRVLSGWTRPDRSLERTLLQQLIDTLHARRVSLERKAGRRAPPRSDTTFTSLLAAFAIIGEAAVGQLVLGKGGLGMSRSEFRRHLTDLVFEKLVGDDPSGREQLLAEQTS